MSQIEKRCTGRARAKENLKEDIKMRAMSDELRKINGKRRVKRKKERGGSGRVQRSEKAGRKKLKKEEEKCKNKRGKARELSIN